MLFVITAHAARRPKCLSYKREKVYLHNNNNNNNNNNLTPTKLLMEEKKIMSIESTNEK